VHLVTIPQVLREYLVVATRPVEVNGLDLSTTDVLRNIRAFRTRVHLLPESIEVHNELMDIVESNSLSGERVHDANVIAAANYHHVSAIITDNAGDYSGLGGTPVLSPIPAVDELRELL